ncbi:MAG: helix-hairpin-helix domain-containing protein [Eubacteriaceae bacterium]|nr:helix-hairpin-helix domain-containing protein [Eubacteriaceae bacterium]
MKGFDLDKIRGALECALSYYKNNDKKVKAATTVIILIVAVLFFAGNGKNPDIEVTGTEDSVKIAEETETATTAMPVYVDISGEVKSPGVYQVAEGTRLFEVIEKAGGLTDNAGVMSINQAEIVTDGQKIIIPDSQTQTTNTNSSGITSDGLININVADSVELQEIPGVGPATASKILAYRESNGSFKNKEDLMNVSGIGQKTYDKIKDLITV